MEIKLLKTSDLNLAATLYALGFAIKGIYPTGLGDKMEFYFDDEEKLRKTMNDYYDRKLRLEPNEIFWARKEILNRVKNDENFKKLPENRD